MPCLGRAEALPRCRDSRIVIGDERCPVIGLLQHTEEVVEGRALGVVDERRVVSLGIGGGRSARTSASSCVSRRVTSSAIAWEISAHGQGVLVNTGAPERRFSGSTDDFWPLGESNRGGVTQARRSIDGEASSIELTAFMCGFQLHKETMA